MLQTETVTEVPSESAVEAESAEEAVSETEQLAEKTVSRNKGS